MAITNDIRNKFLKDKGFNLNLSSEPIDKIDKFLNVLFGKKNRQKENYNNTKSVSVEDKDQETMDILKHW